MNFLKAHPVARVSGQPDRFLFDFKIGDNIVARESIDLGSLRRALRMIHTGQYMRYDQKLTLVEEPVWPEGGPEAVPEKTMEELNAERAEAQASEDSE